MPEKPFITAYHHPTPLGLPQFRFCPPRAMSQHQMPHQLFLRGLRHPPSSSLGTHSPSSRPIFPDSLSLPLFFCLQEDATSPSTSKPSERAPCETAGFRPLRGSRRSAGSAERAAVRQGVDREVAEALTDILIEGIGGKQHLHCVQRCP